MSRQFKFFSVPVMGGEEEEREVNKFLRGVRALTIQKELVENGGQSFWSMAVEYLPGATTKSGEKKQGKVDYRELFSPADYKLFNELRDWRKEQADEEALPLYTLFTNDMVAKIVEHKVTNVKDLQKIKGVGAKRAEKFWRPTTPPLVRACRSVI